MRRSALLLLVAVVGVSGLGFSGLFAATPQMSVSEIRPGMVGIGHTVFEGTRVEEFKARILGVIENVIGTRRNLILARLEGGPLANTGVIAGMSGSPVYIDGKLIGAVSYSLGSFSKEPIAGITPIAEMTDATIMSEAQARPRSARVQLDFPLTPENLTLAFRRALNWNRPFAERSNDAHLVGVSGIAGLADMQVGTLLRPIATPLVMSGFEPDMADFLGAAFRDNGFIPTGGSTRGVGGGEMPFEGPLKAGDAVGVSFLTGDMEMGATGTVTHIDGDRVYAFGHPMYNLGPTEFPMTRAYVYTVLPSLASSLKLSTTGEVIGTFLQDRATAIAGRLGPGPRTIPITLTLESPRGAPRTFHFGVVNDQLFTPLMTYAAILDTLGSYERQNGVASYSVRGKAMVKKHDTITFNNLFAGDTASSGAASYMVSPVAYLMGNDFEKVELEGLEFTIGTSEEPKTATLQRVWLDDPRPRAGRTVPLKVALRTFRGEEVVTHAAGGHPRQRDRLAVDSGHRRRPAGAGRAARSTAAAAAAERLADDPHAQQGPPQQRALRQAARVGSRRGGQRRDVVLAAAVGPGGPRGGSQRRQLQSAGNGHAR